MSFCSYSTNECILSYTFGCISVLYIPAIAFLMIKLHRRRERKVIMTFIPVFLSMIMHYFITGETSNIFYFFKEYFQLISYTYICYFFLHQMYMLFERHVFLTYLGLVALVITIIYLSIISVYFLIASAFQGAYIFNCSNKMWIMISSSGFLLAILFVSIGVVVKNNLKNKEVLYRDQVNQQIRDMWVLIFIFTLSRIVSFAENLIFVSFSVDNCIIPLGNPAESFIIFTIIRIITDYLIISTVILQFWKRFKQEQAASISDSDPSDIHTQIFCDMHISELNSNTY